MPAPCAGAAEHSAADPAAGRWEFGEHLSEPRGSAVGGMELLLFHMVPLLRGGHPMKAAAVRACSLPPPCSCFQTIY